MLVRQQVTVEFGFVKDYPSTTVNYEGDGETGVTITIEATYGEAKGIRINNTTRGEYIIINDDKLSAIVGSGLTRYDKIVIDTTRGNKSAKLLRDGTTKSILNAIDLSSKWIQLQKGNNVFTVTTTSGLANLTISIDYKQEYLGV